MAVQASTICNLDDLIKSSIAYFRDNPAVYHGKDCELTTTPVSLAVKAILDEMSDTAVIVIFIHAAVQEYSIDGFSIGGRTIIELCRKTVIAAVTNIIKDQHPELAEIESFRQKTRARAA